MKLRYKFSLLALLYVVTLAANFALCSWCLLLYYHSFLESHASELLWTGEARTPADDHPRYGAGIPTEHVLQPIAPGPEQSDIESHILSLLAGNALSGVILGLIGLRLANRWVIEPVAALRDAAAEIGRGNLAYRVAVPAGDELGDLTREINSMAFSIVSMQGELVEHERKQAAHQALRCVIHNIRSPLTGIRWLAEAIGMRKDIDAETEGRQARIIEIVDRLLAWLQANAWKDLHG